MLTTEQVPRMLRICYLFKKRYNTSRLISILGNNMHSQPSQQMQLYTMFHKKTTRYSIAHNFGKC